MGTVFKKFSAQDKALIPFNAHKQYNFTSASAASNSLTWFNASWTSESVSMYGTSHTDGYGSDVINFIKYSQIDHLFYRNFKKTVGDKMGPINYLEQPRTLYQKANILSIPSGLYGFEIKPGSFYLSASSYQIIDDKKGNLIISGTNLDNYPNDIQQNVFKLEPVDGFKRYDLDVFSDYAHYKYVNKKTGFHTDIIGGGWRRGKNSPNAPVTYTSIMGKPREIYPENEDDSYFINKIYYNNVQFAQSISSSSEIKFNSRTGSYISSSHHERYNFDKDENFSVSFYIRPISLDAPVIGTAAIGQNVGGVNTQFIVSGELDLEKRYIIAKSGTKRVTNSLSSSAESSEPQFPFEIYHISNSLHFERSDGNQKYAASASLGETGNYNIVDINTHILCQSSGSKMQIWENGAKLKEEDFTIKEQTRNTSNLYIGSKGEHKNTDFEFSLGTAVIGSSFIVDGFTDGGIGVSVIGSTFVVDNYGPLIDKGKFFNGNISNINIYSKAHTPNTILNISSSLNGSPYIGNCFYQAGFAVITHPLYQNTLQNPGNEYSLNKIQFQGTHLIYEHEYQCTVSEDEFNSTYNLSARKVKSSKKHTLADFTTGSNFSTFITTIGLYDEKGDCLVVGKLGQPIRMSDETDTTFVLRWDT
tara:strand:+ start:18054 stop:19985 length:1932 start_codon:yes stop_codon:yes gene_type:complete